MAEAAFSEDGKYFSSITQDGRLKIWDTETSTLKQEYTPDLHLSSPPTCLQWLNILAVSSAPKGNRRKSISDIETPVIALGTSSGKILLYSVAQAKVESILQDKHRLTCLDWNRVHGLYSCNKDNQVREWDIQTSTFKNVYKVNIDSSNKQGNVISAIKVFPSNQISSNKYLVTSSTQVHVWKLHGNESTLIKSLGHNASPKAILALATINNTCWLVEGSQNERLLSFWDVTVSEDPPLVNGDGLTPSKRSRKKSLTQPTVVPTPTYNFLLEDAPKCIDVKLKEVDGASKLSLAATTRSGVIHFYGHILNGSSTKPIKPSVTIQVTTGEAVPMSLQCCRLAGPPAADGMIVVGYSNGAALVFDNIMPDLKSKTQVLIRGEARSGKKKKQKGDKVHKEEVKDGQKVTYVEPMGGVARKRPTPGGTVEVPMEARLENLSLDIKSRSHSAVNQNLTRLLMQGLHSKDKHMILTVLQKDDQDVALRTLSTLPADYVPLLLAQLTDLATRKTSQCACVCTWLTALLRCHSALLLASVNAQQNNHLTQLLAIFTHRRSHLCQLLNLRGRLNLAMAQKKSSHKDAVMDQEPALLYRDSSSDEEMEVEKYQSDASVHSWDDASEAEDGSDDQD